MRLDSMSFLMFLLALQLCLLLGLSYQFVQAQQAQDQGYAIEAIKITSIGPTLLVYRYYLPNAYLH